MCIPVSPECAAFEGKVSLLPIRTLRAANLTLKSSTMNEVVSHCFRALLDCPRRLGLPLVLLLAFATLVSAQTAPTHRALPSKSYCHPSAGFCFHYPASWAMLGEVFDGNGVVVAPEQAGDRAQWDAITVALVATAGENDEGPSLSSIIERTTAAMRDAGQNFETLQRRELTVDHNPAQMLKAQYRENGTTRDWVEELVFIQDADDDIYSVALKCAPDHLPRLEPALKELLASWSVPQPEPPSETAPSNPSPPAQQSPQQEKP
jgi:hypothetical protein